VLRLHFLKQICMIFSFEKCMANYREAGGTSPFKR
jgi:hypothetical protein